MCVDISSLLHNILFLLGTIEVFWIVIFAVVVWMVWRAFAKFLFLKIALTLILVFFLALMSFVSLIVVAFVTDDNYVASYYGHMHAAIKNTCILDPDRRNCPRDVEGIIHIEPESFELYKGNSYLFYEYREKENSYSFVALKKDSRKGVVFDPRLKEITPGKVDFLDVTYTKCGNKIRINEKVGINGFWDRGFEVK